MRFLPPLVHQDVEGYEEVFEVHAEHRLPFGELSRRQWRASGQRPGYAHQFMDGPSPRRFGGRRVQAPLVWAGACTIRPGAPRCRTLAGCRDLLPMTPSSSRTGAAIKPGTVHETSPNTSAATASRRNAAAGPIEYSRTRRWVMMAPTKNRMRPTAAAVSISSTPMRPTSNPSAPAALRVPSMGSHDSGTPTLAAVMRTKLKRIISAVAAKVLAAMAIRVTMT